MIALPSRLPLLRVGRYELASYEKQWLTEAIEAAARCAGHEEGWWFASDVARSLLLYLRDRYPGTAVTLEEVTEKIQKTLKSIGFGEIGAHLALRPPPLTLSLEALAVEAEGVELAFFQLLSERLEELRGLGASRLALTGTRSGVKRLRGARNWSPRCEDLAAEIHDFLRGRLRHLPGCAVEFADA